jgi:hypothetical protein
MYKGYLKDILDSVGTDTALFVKAYLDGSGTEPQSKIIFVGGIIASINQWVKLEGKWNGVLKQNKLPLFHASDFNSAGEVYADLDLTTQKIAEVNGQFATAIGSCSMRYFGVGLRKDDFRIIKVELGKPPISDYQVCLGQCFSLMATWLADQQNIQAAAVFVEKGEKYKNRIMSAWEKASQPYNLSKTWKMGAFSVLDKKGIPPFQVADFIIYELYKYFTKLASGDLSKPRPAFQTLLDAGKFSITFNNMDSLRSTIKSMVESQKRLKGILRHMKNLEKERRQE